MIGYVTLGTNDLDRGGDFYDALLSEVGARRISTSGRMIVYGVQSEAPMLAICTPFDELEATAGNGVMISLSVDSPAGVDRLHARALELGATNEGEPGPRDQTSAYIGYFRDADGNKLAVFTMVE